MVKMNKENGVLYLTAIVAIFLIAIGITVAFYQSMIAIPIVVLGLIFLILILLTNKGNIAHNIESLEKIFFVITFLVIVVGFILLYKPI